MLSLLRLMFRRQISTNTAVPRLLRIRYFPELYEHSLRVPRYVWFHYLVNQNAATGWHDLTTVSWCICVVVTNVRRMPTDIIAV